MREIYGCPFCGGEVNIWDHTFGTVWVVECLACKAKFVFAWNVAENLYDFAAYWNRRGEKKRGGQTMFYTKKEVAAPEEIIKERG